MVGGGIEQIDDPGPGRALQQLLGVSGSSGHDPTLLGWHNRPCVRLVIQRVSRSAVRVGGELVGAIDAGLLVLVGIEPGDTGKDVERAVEKIANLRVFPDEAGQMNRSLLETGGAALVVSQFTLLGNSRKGRRPSFTGAAPPQIAEPMVGELSHGLRRAGVITETGVFGASMEVELVNQGPVTLVIDIRGGRVS